MGKYSTWVGLVVQVYPVKKHLVWMSSMLSWRKKESIWFDKKNKKTREIIVYISYLLEVEPSGNIKSWGHPLLVEVLSTIFSFTFCLESGSSRVTNKLWANSTHFPAKKKILIWRKNISINKNQKFISIISYQWEVVDDFHFDWQCMVARTKKLQIHQKMLNGVLQPEKFVKSHKI